MRLALWTHPADPSLSRIYINNIPAPAGDGKAYLTEGRRGLKLVVTPSEARAEVIDELVAAGHIGAEADLATMVFSTFAPRVASVSRRDRRSPIHDPRARMMVPHPRAAAAAALDPATINVPEPVTIRIDHREPVELFEALTGLPNVEVERCELPLGDIELNGRVLIERKCCGPTGARTDFESSVIDPSRRLFFQSEKLRLERDVLPVIILEGDPHEHADSMSVQSVDGAVSFLLAVQRLNVITTYGIHHTAYVALKIATHERSGLGYDVPLRADKPKAIGEQLSFLLEGLPGVSAALARRLAEHFGSLRALVNASDAELRKVPGMGPKRVAQIRPLLSGEPGASPGAPEPLGTP